MRLLLDCIIFSTITILLSKSANAIQCYECSSEDDKYCATFHCNQDAVLPTKICEFDVTSCFTKIQNDVVIRSCMPIEKSNYSSEKHSDSFMYRTCSTPLCNNDKIEPEFCIPCDAQNADCRNSVTSSMSKKCRLTSQAIGCYHFEEGEEIERGCVSDIDDISFREICESNNEKCKTCIGNYCNSQPAGLVADPSEDQGLLGNAETEIDSSSENRKGKNENSSDLDNIEDNDYNKIPIQAESCNTCDSQDQNCKIMVTDEMRKTCFTDGKFLGCYHFEENDQVKRGCISDIEDDNFRKLCESNGERCKSCTESMCNSKYGLQACFVSNNPNSQTTDTATLESKICNNYSDECFIHVANNTVRRGCLGDMVVPIEQNELQADCENSDICEKCSGINCNDKKIQNEYCIVCDSNCHSNCKHDPSNSMRNQCPLAIRPFGCLMYQSESNFIRRDCMSTDSELRAVCYNETNTCKYCFGDECNKKRYFTVCHSCRSAMGYGQDCIVSPWIAPLKTCKDYEDECFTHIDNNGIVTRGCLREFNSNSENCTTDNNCVRCNDENGCNDNVITPESCITCDIQDPKCKNKVSRIMSKKCVLSQNPLGCYHFEENDQVKRGCISEIEDNAFRIMCESNGDTCKKCIGNECNSRQSGFLKCLTGDQLDPQNSESKICTNYVDECFVYAKNDTLHRGCISDVNILQRNALDIRPNCEHPDNCEICSETENCNDKIIEKEHCIVCDSTLEPDCLYEPSSLMRNVCPLTINPTGCFMFQNQSFDVKRNCMSSDPKLREICLAENDTCKHCFGNECNKKAYFTRCYTCSSDKDEKCVASPWQTELKTCKQYMDECFTNIDDNDIVTRGCFDEFKSGEENCTNADTCLRCSGPNGCNSAAITPKSCLTCDSGISPMCETNVLPAISETCSERTINPMGCYHFINDTDGHTKRGCISNLSPSDISLAIIQSNEWKHCDDRNNCNSRKTFSKCFSCDSKTDANCMHPISSDVQTKICSSYNDLCYSFIGSKNVMRGCLDDLDFTTIINCRSSPEKCAICTADDDNICNNIEVNEATCIACDSDADDRCRSQPEVLDQKLCSSVDSLEEDLGCFLMHYDKNQVRRGCVSDLSVQHQQICRNGFDECGVCKGNNCNKKIDFQRCYSCSSKTNANCSQDNSLETIKKCRNYYDHCSTAIDSHGFTVRQCMSNDTNVENLEEFTDFEECNESNCNGKIFPENRLKCFQCDGESACNSNVLEKVHRTDKSVNLERKPCTVHVEDDQCFTYIDNERNMHRGCLSDSKNSRIFCEKNSFMCVTCGEDGCNNHPLLTPSKLSCHKCNHSTECGYGQVDQQTIQECIGSVWFGSIESCYTRSSSEGKVERGCTLDIVDENRNWCKDDENCTECEDNACNNENSYFSYCLQCDSINDKNCENPLTNEFFVKCLTNRRNDRNKLDDSKKNSFHHPYAMTKRGCYTMTEDGIVKRGCVIDLSEDQHKVCNATDWCNICDYKNCNNRKFTSKATKLSSCILLSILTALMIQQFR